MRFHVARQPIFNRKMQVYGYELLYRHADTENFYNPPEHINGDQATSNVIINSFYNIGIEQMTSGRKAFINFTDNFLAQEIATLFPADILVVEILENVDATPAMMQRCRELKALGYLIALDDFVLSPENADFLELADIIKIDFMITPLVQIRDIIRRSQKPNRLFLAEKIESREVYDQALAMGFTYFQGYFFSKPIIISGEDLRPMPINCIRLLQLVNRTDFNFHLVSRIVMRDVSLTYQLLRLVNSVGFGYTSKIKTVQHALVALGTKEVRKWISLVSMMGINAGQPMELNRISLIRATFCEYLCHVNNGSGDPVTAFMTGLFSLMDVIMGRSFEDIFKEIAVTTETKKALLEREGILYGYIELISAYESGNWKLVDQIAQKIDVDVDVISDAYRNAIRWSGELLGDID